MKIGFAPVSTVEVKHVFLLSELEHKLNSYFQGKNYGEGLKEVYINVIIVSQGLKRFFKQRKPQYIYNYRNQVLNTVSYSIGRALKYYINLNFEQFNNANESEAREMLKKEVLASIGLFDRYGRKIKEFNVTLFRHDMRHFFEEISV